jgi:hypothetical protein
VTRFFRPRLRSQGFRHFVALSARQGAGCRAATHHKNPAVPKASKIKMKALLMRYFIVFDGADVFSDYA